jgi:glycosyltransferase involved in cell wall biosynthesis
MDQADQAVQKGMTKPSAQRRGWPYINRDLQPLPIALTAGSPWPRISIVTPSYNQGAFIEETILSVANQGYPNVEHIIIDGGSSDETTSVLYRYSDLITYWVSEPDRGQGNAINKGMARATGVILTWLNSDDRLAPGALAAVALAFHYSKADLVAGVAELYMDGDLVRHHLTACSNGPLPLDDLLDLHRCWFPGQFFYQPEVMFTRELWERAGSRVDESLTYSMDYELWVRFAEKSARLHVIGRPVAQFRMHKSQKTHVSERFRAELTNLNGTILERLQKSVSGEVPEPRPLRVAMLNDVGFHFGAGGAHKRLAQALAWGGASVMAFSFQQGLAPMGQIDIKSIVTALDQVQPDFVLIGNLHGAKTPPELLDAITDLWPTFWVLHDFWILTGRCAYTAGCKKLLTGCDATCPTADQYPVLPPAEIGPAWAAKRRVLTNFRAPSLLANSSYTQNFARHVLGFGSEPASKVQEIRLGVPTQIFVPCDKSVARHLLNIEEDAFVLFISACDLDEPRKGGAILADALSRLKIPKLMVIAAGWYDPQKPSPIPNLRRMGHIEDDSRMALLYSAADLLVGASQEETFGQVYVEAALCGTPVVAFRTSGVTDAVKNGISGVLVPSFSAEELAKTIERLYFDVEETQRMSMLGRRFAENEFSLARSHQSLIAMLIRTGIIDRLRLPRNSSMGVAIPDVECSLLLRASMARTGSLRRIFILWFGIKRQLYSEPYLVGPLFGIGRRFARALFPRRRPGWVKVFAWMLRLGDLMIKPVTRSKAKVRVPDSNEAAAISTASLPSGRRQVPRVQMRQGQ